MNKQYYFTQYFPGFVDNGPVSPVAFTRWHSFIREFEKTHPPLKGYRYAYAKDDWEPFYLLMVVSKKENSWLVIGFTDFPLNKKYRNWRKIVQVGEKL